METTTENADMNPAPRRGRPPGSANAPKPSGGDTAFVEIRLRRKYVPEFCFVMEHGDGIPRAVIVRDEETNQPIRQKDVVVDERLDKFGRHANVYREIFESVPEGAIVSVPKSEVARLINSGVAEMTSNTF